MDMTVAFLHGFAAQPEQRLALTGTKAEERGKASSAADITLIHEQFVQSAPAESAAESHIDRLMPKWRIVSRRRRTAGFKPFQLPLQAG